MKKRRLLLPLFALLFAASPAMAGQDCSNVNAKPHSGDQNVPEATIINGVRVPTTVNLNGTTSLPVGQVSCQWTQFASESPQVTIADPNACATTFTAPDVGPSGQDFHFQLKVTSTQNDCTNLTDTKQTKVTITDVASQNQPPVAKATASASTVNEGEEVTLDGSTSTDPDGNLLTYLWEQVFDTSTGTSTVTLGTPTGVSTKFNAPPEVYPNGETLKFRLTVTDTGGLSNSTDILINVQSVNQPPVASIITCPGPVREGDLITLDGSNSSDPDLGQLAYDWSQTQGAPIADLSKADLTAASIQFTAPKLENCYPNDTMKFGLTVTDNGKQSAATECDIKILDITPPVISVPQDITAEATSAEGAVVNFNATAHDAFYGDEPVTCNPASGSTFTIDPTTSKTTTVTCSSSDQADSPNTATAFFKVTVQDTTPPKLSLPSVNAEGNTLGGAKVSYTASAIDLVDGSVVVTCDKAPDNFVFPVGTTAVNCSATDAHNNTASGILSVTVTDTAPPKIEDHSLVPVYATSASGAVATYSNPAAYDIVDGAVAVSCTPASGSNFNIGQNTVTCTATDSHNNSASKSFIVSVIYNWTGFFQPVDKIPVMNTVKAGSAVPVKFSLGGNMGLNIFASGYPGWADISADTSLIEAPIDQTVTAGGSSLTYDATANQYIYIWKTDKTWAGTSKQLQIKLADGTPHVAYFKFK